MRTALLALVFADALGGVFIQKVGLGCCEMVRIDQRMTKLIRMLCSATGDCGSFRVNYLIEILVSAAMGRV